MLTVYTPSLPFMSDEALAAALPGRPEYTVKKYIQLVEALRAKAAALTSSSGQHWERQQQYLDHGPESHQRQQHYLHTHTANKECGC